MVTGRAAHNQIALAGLDECVQIHIKYSVHLLVHELTFLAKEDFNTAPTPIP